MDVQLHLYKFKLYSFVYQKCVLEASRSLVLLTCIVHRPRNECSLHECLSVHSTTISHVDISVFYANTCSQYAGAITTESSVHMLTANFGETLGSTQSAGAYNRTLSAIVTCGSQVWGFTGL